MTDEKQLVREVEPLLEPGQASALGLVLGDEHRECGRTTHSA